MLILNGKIISWEEPNRILEGQAVRVENGLVAEISPQAELLLRYPEDERLDANGQYVMPGNICAHTHFYGAFARGMGIPGEAPKNFVEILQKLWWPLDLALDAEAVRYSALVCLVEAIRHGTTTLIDHHASPNFIDGSLDVIAEAVEESGVRAILCYEVTDRNGADGALAGIKENLRFIERVRAQGKSSDQRLAATFGLHASLTLSDETLEACREAVPEGVGFHIHVAESEADQEDSLRKAKMRVVKRLQQHVILGPKSIAVHCVHVDDEEIEVLADTGTWVTHQPRSNMNNAVGLPAVEKLLKAGVRVCLGNDGFSNAMWEEWKTAYLVHKLWQGDPRHMNGMDVVKMGVYNNAALAGVFFPEALLGKIQIGAQADMIFVDYHPYTPLTEGNLPWQILFGFHESMVTTTMVGGKVLMHNRKLLLLDEDSISEEARKIAPAVWARYNQVMSKQL
jgi:putative selenium metabolism protein SsnA